MKSFLSNFFEFWQLFSGQTEYVLAKTMISNRHDTYSSLNTFGQYRRYLLLNGTKILLPISNNDNAYISAVANLINILRS